MRQKQEPRFSKLEKTELDISSGEKEKGHLPSEGPLPDSLAKPTGAWPSVAIAAEPLPDQPRTYEIRLFDAPFIYIAPGSFIMGSPEHESGRGSDETQHEVTLTRGYTIQATPVTQGQWKALMGSNPSCFLQGGEDCPVEGISWNECQEFIKKVNEVGDYTYRLPTEAEWEYACRAGASAALFNGEITELFCRLDPCLDAAGWYCGNSGRKTHPVAEKNPNAWGLFDMHGNVCEWCQDWYGEYAAMPQADPPGAAFGPGRVVRGGSWFSSSQNCRSASRFYRPPNSRCDFIGFRVVRE
jgi:formylglycine-generating enzyme required for sulfatase activity